MTLQRARKKGISDWISALSTDGLTHIERTVEDMALVNTESLCGLNFKSFGEPYLESVESPDMIGLNCINVPGAT